MKSQGMYQAVEVTGRLEGDISIPNDFISETPDMSGSVDVSRGSLALCQGFNENDLIGTNE